MDINRLTTEILSKVNIVDIISNYISLDRKGNNYWGLCPFHADKSPSLCVSIDKQIYTCWSCRATGHAIKFVQNYEKIGYLDACRKVCEIANIRMPEELEKAKTEVKEDPNKRYYQLMSDLSAFYTFQLSSEEGVDALNYLKGRNITEEDIQFFRLGYAPADGLKSIEFLRKKGYTDDEIISCGVGRDNSGTMRDVYAGRIIFSITNKDNKVCAFSGRVFNGSSDSKYVNTPDTILFHKNEILYNYFNASLESRIVGYTIVVEGFMDAIAIYKAGIKTVVATMGTAFTDNHISLLKKLKSEIRLFFDADGPGIDATLRGISMLQKQDVPFHVIKRIEGYKDIDEVLKNEGKQRVVHVLSQVQSALEYKMNNLERTLNFANHEDVKTYVKDAAKILAEAHIEELDKEFYISHICKKASVSAQAVRKIIAEQSVSSNSQEYDYPNIPDYGESWTRVKKNLDKYEQADHQILKMMIDNPVFIHEFLNSGVSLVSRAARQLAALIVDLDSKNMIVDYPTLLTYAENNKDVCELLTDISEESPAGLPMDKLVSIIKDDFYAKIEIQELEEQLKSETDLKKQLEIAEKLMKIRRGN